MQSSSCDGAAWFVCWVGFTAGGLLAACSDDDAIPLGVDAGSGGSAGSGGTGAGGKATGGESSGGAGGGQGAVDGGNREISVSFEAVIGGSPIDCTATYSGLGTTSKELAPTDFRYFVHDVRFLDAGGTATPARLVVDGKWQTDQVALLDYENNQGTCENGTREVRKEIVVKRPPGVFRGIAFRIGVPADLNHENPVAAPSPLNLTALHWSWNFGYKFARLDFKRVHPPVPEGGMPMPEAGPTPMPEGGPMPMPDGGGMHHGGAGSVLLHLGSVGCNASDAGAPGCGVSNRPDIRLQSFDPETQVIVLDYAKIVAGVDLSTDHGGAPGCMGDPADPECAPIFDALGLQLTGATKPEQTAFGVVNR